MVDRDPFITTMSESGSVNILYKQVTLRILYGFYMGLCANACLAPPVSPYI